jgi:ketosteroid isomerase-like protein
MGKRMLKIIFSFAIGMLFAGPAVADDRALITQQMQALADAIASGDAAVWDKYLDPDVIYAEEDDSFKGKMEMLQETRPLPKGLSGEIKITLLLYHEDGDTAVGLFRQIETEHYYAQTIYANYLTNTTWKKRADGWKMIAAQVLAEKTDPPAVALPAAQLAQYAGTYKLMGSDATYTITLNGNALIAARNGRKPSLWNAEASDVFFAKGDPRIRNLFQRDSAGRITGFVERRESWDIVWEKIG